MDEKNERFIKQLLWISATIETLCFPMTRLLHRKIKTFSFIFSSERKFIENCSNYDSNESIRYKVQYTKWWWLTGINHRKVLGINFKLRVTKIDLFDFSSVIFFTLSTTWMRKGLSLIWIKFDIHPINMETELKSN
jgi:hypothetical protein